MTWTGHFTVQSVTGTRPVEVVLSASAAVTVRPFSKSSDEKFAATEVPGLVSNTEGRMLSAELRLVLDEDESLLQVGDLLTVNGHYS